MNPFKYGQVVSGRDFCARPALMDQLTEFVISGQNAFLTGERRIGKTSLIHQTLENLDQYRKLYIDLLEIKSISDICRRMISPIVLLENREGFYQKILRTLSQLRPTLSLDPVTGQPTVSINAAADMMPDSITGLLTLITDMRKHGKLVVIFDEFQDILNLKNAMEALALLRSGIQFHTDICYIFAGSIRSRMDTIFTDSESPFFKSAAAIEVGPINEKVFSRFLKERFASGKRRVPEGIIRKILDLTQQIPGDAQEFCGCIWDCSSRGDEISQELFLPALELIYTREGKAYESALTLLTSLQFRCLVTLARMGGDTPLSAGFLKESGIKTPSSVQKALARLMKLKIIYRSGGKYKFTNPFFGSWLVWKNY